MNMAKLRFKTCVSLCLLAACATIAYAQSEGDIASTQYEGELTAKHRLFPEVGIGLRAVKRGDSDKTYVLSSQGLMVFDAKDHKLLTIGAPTTDAPASKTAAPGATAAGQSFAEDFDVDAAGQIYVADRAANLIVKYSADGNRIKSFHVNAPLSVTALPDGEVAVATLHDPHLILVFDKNGRDIRDFGELEEVSSREDLNRYLNAGYLATDARGNIYYAFIYTPEPLVRQYDRNGYASQTIQFTEIEAFAAAQAARKEIERQERKGKQPAFKPILTAIGVVRASGEVWIALHNRLLRFDKDGNRKATYQLYTPDGTRLDANSIVVEKDRILIGSDPLGIFEFERPDIKLGQ
jgi:predicted DNA-binding WGR domain protein